MSETVLICPKCSGKMDLGYVEDRSDADRYRRHWFRKRPNDDSWISGDPKDFEDLKITIPELSQFFDGVLIGTFRCQSCGFLESYARHEFEEDEIQT